MGKANKAAKKLDPGHLLKSSLITVAVAEIIPLLFGALYLFWQTRYFGPIDGVKDLINKGTYGWTEMESAMSFGAGAGAIIVLGIIVALATLIIDEWVFSHKLSTLKDVITSSVAWGVSFLIIDKILFVLGIPTIAGLSTYALIVFIVVIMVTPVAIYFARKISKK
jgi:uncharacterized membrane protein